jgi:hypothetical protein
MTKASSTSNKISFSSTIMKKMRNANFVEIHTPNLTPLKWLRNMLKLLRLPLPLPLSTPSTPPTPLPPAT